MTHHHFLRSCIAIAAATLIAACGGGGDDVATPTYEGVRQTNLVANKASYQAQIVEPALINAWGIAIRPAGLGGHFWIGASSGQSIEYVGDVGGQPLFQDALTTVATQGPTTGIAFNPGTNFRITQSHPNGTIEAPAKFVFANASGTLTAWTERARVGGGFDHPLDSVLVVDGTGRDAAFLGVAVSPSGQRLFAADFGAQPGVRIYDGQFAETGMLPDPFVPTSGPAPGGFAPFNVQTVGQSVFVMYGRHVPPGGAQPAEGRLAEFDDEGRLLHVWQDGGKLNYPWGIAMAPTEFGQYGGCLLIGNFGDGTIVAFDPRTRKAVDHVRDAQGRPLVIDGLWGLQFGNGASLGEANDLYFAAGPNREADGLFGKLEAITPAAGTTPAKPLCR
ncbi:TIGR03118 family protein [Piscinibacter sp. XHJ-5]|uniref:TIGR03118 family protein n=1 Tax=Piscinibacter sp. XHJ-5 TaxID=3037797 RepID=UPI002452ABEE|nr:TIGR03118 family protein [Piscinibacter sp. XHJ-5]